MSRIIYGVSGEGSGHSTRAREMTRCLQAAGHEVVLASYGRGIKNLADEFDVVPIEGLTISSEDNRVLKRKTIIKNLKRLPAGNVGRKRLRRRFRDFKPHAVITDFEPLTAYFAEHYRLPLITLDNQHRMRYLDFEVPPGHKRDAKLTRRLIRLMVPWPSVSLVTAFTTGKVRNERTFVFPPIVSSEVQSLVADDGTHILVYLTNGFDGLLDKLKGYRREQFIVYGYDRVGRDDNLTFKPASRSEFLRDLATSKAVIATAGFTLISEALYLGKPYLAAPMAGQFEQQLNAFQLHAAGYGAAIRELTDCTVGEFLYRLDDYRRYLRRYDRDPGRALKAKLLELVQDDARLAMEFRKNRKRHAHSSDATGESTSESTVTAEESTQQDGASSDAS